jgi:hypothetical protein
MKPLFNFILGLAMVLFGILVAFLFLKDVDFHNFEFNKKLVLRIAIPAVILLVGIERMFKGRNRPR